MKEKSHYGLPPIPFLVKECVEDESSRTMARKAIPELVAPFNKLMGDLTEESKNPPTGPSILLHKARIESIRVATYLSLAGYCFGLPVLSPDTDAIDCIKELETLGFTRSSAFFLCSTMKAVNFMLTGMMETGSVKDFSCGIGALREIGSGDTMDLDKMKKVSAAMEKMGSSKEMFHEDKKTFAELLDKAKAAVERGEDPDAPKVATPEQAKAFEDAVKAARERASKYGPKGASQ